jgi:hypothetical protein
MVVRMATSHDNRDVKIRGGVPWNKRHACK